MLNIWNWVWTVRSVDYSQEKKWKMKWVSLYMTVFECLEGQKIGKWGIFIVRWVGNGLY